MKLQYDLINEDNIKLAISIQGVIFPGESAGEHYQYAISTNYCDCAYYIVKWNDIPVGVTGVYTMNMYVSNQINDDSVWLGWYGILPEFRSRGIGRQTLLDTIEKAKIYKRKYFRLYTTDTDDSLARALYRNVMHIYESYQNEHDYIEDENCTIYSYSFDNTDVELWNNRYAYINDDIKMSCIANDKLNDKYKILIINNGNFKDVMRWIKLATSFREDGHLVTVDTIFKESKQFDIIIEENLLLDFANDDNTEKLLKEFKMKIYQDCIKKK